MKSAAEIDEHHWCKVTEGKLAAAEAQIAALTARVEGLTGALEKAKAVLEEDECACENEKCQERRDVLDILRAALHAPKTETSASGALGQLRLIILEALHDVSEPGWCLGLAALSARTNLPRESLRGIIADLRAEGLVSHHIGLWTEDGEPAGAGYALTDKGASYRERLCEGDAAILRAMEGRDG